MYFVQVCESGSHLSAATVQPAREGSSTTAQAGACQSSPRSTWWGSAPAARPRSLLIGRTPALAGDWKASRTRSSRRRNWRRRSLLKRLLYFPLWGASPSFSTCGRSPCTIIGGSFARCFGAGAKRVLPWGARWRPFGVTSA
ncbi:unnamed protein product [Ectocarpus fasciculatus]